MQKVQLDNQMLDAVQPVVLAPAVEYRPSGAVGSTAKEPPLVSFSFTRRWGGRGGPADRREGRRWGVGGGGCWRAERAERCLECAASPGGR